MKKWVSGVIVGVMLASTTVVGAASQNITVQHTPQVKFKFNGTEKALPEGYTVLMHQDRTYVPARFITDNMGGSVDWDNATETVQIETDAINKADVEELQQLYRLVGHITYVGELYSLSFTLVDLMRMADTQEHYNQIYQLATKINVDYIRSAQNDVSSLPEFANDKHKIIDIGEYLIAAKEATLSGKTDEAFEYTKSGKVIVNELYNRYSMKLSGDFMRVLSR